MPDTPWLIASLGRSLCLNFLVFKSCFLPGSLHSKMSLTLQNEVMTHAGVFKQVQGRQENRDLFFLPGGLTWEERLRVLGLCSSEHSLNLKSRQRKKNIVRNFLMRRSDTTFTVKRWLCGSHVTWDGFCGLFYPGWVTGYTLIQLKVRCQKMVKDSRRALKHNVCFAPNGVRSEMWRASLISLQRSHTGWWT